MPNTTVKLQKDKNSQIAASKVTHTSLLMILSQLRLHAHLYKLSDTALEFPVLLDGDIRARASDTRTARLDLSNWTRGGAGSAGIRCSSSSTFDANPSDRRTALLDTV